MLEFLKTKTPLSKIITAAICTLIEGELIGSAFCALDFHDTNMAIMCGISSLIILPLLCLYWYSIFKTVEFKDKTKS